jgi:hypothetical protein
MTTCNLLDRYRYLVRSYCHHQWLVKVFIITHTHNTLEPHVTRSFRSLKTGSHMLQKKVLHTVQSSASFFNFQYPLSSLMSFISCLCFLLHLPITSDPSLYLSFNNTFWKAVPTQDSILFIVCRIFLTSLILCGNSIGGVTGDTNFKFYLTSSNFF